MTTTNTEEQRADTTVADLTHAEPQAEPLMSPELVATLGLNDGQMRALAEAAPTVMRHVQALPTADKDGVKQAVAAALEEAPGEAAAVFRALGPATVKRLIKLATKKKKKKKKKKKTGETDDAK